MIKKRNFIPLKQDKAFGIPVLNYLDALTEVGCLGMLPVERSLVGSRAMDMEKECLIEDKLISPLIVD